ncbi:MAG: hypothetical protein HXX08_09375 [Chloroflexi bacterium]|uniref:Uncharacterized protein n=1 Tax=Candidatus Chlorohelix allophototropha TaxID=3003348 RepID=A0A8T7M3J4_9CHLR|nr:hypothetical protein [Chloroflexota bacterium]WJW67935.1 hypothetical protein OZ401_001219 [Chloroflexota bacterium L227-S17]
MLNSFKNQLDLLVKGGKMTQAQSEEVLKAASALVNGFIDSVPSGGGSRKNP